MNAPPRSGSQGLASLVYNTLMKRNSVFYITVFASAFAFGIGYDTATTAFWDRWNKGKQWKDIREKYVSN